MSCVSLGDSYSYHSRSPYYSVITSSILDVKDPLFDTDLVGNSPMAGYKMEYPENVELYAATFKTELADGTTKFSGELSIRPNMPLQINSTDLTYTALGVDSISQEIIGKPISPTVIQGKGSIAEDTYVKGYDRLPLSQAQLAFSQFDPCRQSRRHKLGRF